MMTTSRTLLVICAIAVVTDVRASAGLIASGKISGHHLSGPRVDYTATGEDQRTITTLGGIANSTHTAMVTTEGLKSGLVSDFSGFSSVLVGVVDTYTITGGTAGETITLNAVLRVDGNSIVATHLGSKAFINASIGYGLDANGDPTQGNPVIAGGFVSAPQLVLNNTGAFDFNVIAPLTVQSGSAFQLSFATRILHGGVATTDMLNTASVSFELPEGYSISSIEGFGTQSSSAAVPEPSSIALFALGSLGLLGYGRRRQKPMGSQQTSV